MKNERSVCHEMTRLIAADRSLTVAALFACLCAAGPAMFGQAVPAKGSIEGQVVDAKTNAPIKKAAITLQGSMPFLRPGQPPSQNGPLTAETDEKGNFSFHDLDAGNYTIRAQHQGYVTFPFQGYPNAAVVLGRGQDLKGVVVKLTPQAVITGKVLDEDGEAVQGAQVAVLRQDERHLRGLRDLPDFDVARRDHSRMAGAEIGIGERVLCRRDLRLGDVERTGGGALHPFGDIESRLKRAAVDAS